MGKQCQTLFLGAPKSLQMVTAARKLRRLPLGRKVMTNLDSILKSRDITLPTKVRLFSQSYGFSSGHVWIWELGYKESWAPNHWWFWTVVLEKILRVPWISRRSKQSILKEISPESSLEGLMLKLNSNSLATRCEDLTRLKKPWCWERRKVGGEGDNRGWDGWVALTNHRTWVWLNSGGWWWIGRPGMLQSMVLQSRTQLSDWTVYD